MKKTSRRDKVRMKNFNKRSPKDLLYFFIFILITAGITKSLIAPSGSLHAEIKFSDNPIRSFYAKTFAQAEPLISPLASDNTVAIIKLTPTPTPVPVNPFDKRSPKGIAWDKNLKMFGADNWDSLETLITNESGWNPYAVNGRSGACGLGQALPCSKMGCDDWDYACQVDWVLGYIADRYTTPNAALTFWLSRQPIDGRDVGNWY